MLYFLPLTVALVSWAQDLSAANQTVTQQERTSSIVFYVANILAKVVPLLRAPSPDFILRIEEQLLVLIMHGKAQMVSVEHFLRAHLCLARPLLYCLSSSTSICG